MILGALLIAISMLLFLYNLYTDKKAGETAQAMIPEIKQVINEFDSGDRIDTVEAQSAKMPTIVIDGHPYIGYLSIPAFELELPVMSEWNYDRLEIAPCRQFGSLSTDDLVIAGHNYSSHFRSLWSLTAGNAVSFTDMKGDTVDYIVEDVKILQPTESDWVEHSGFDLILYTCTYGGNTRVVVCCNSLSN